MANDLVNVPVVGYANKAGKAAALRDAGAIAVTDTMVELADAFEATAVRLPR